MSGPLAPSVLEEIERRLAGIQQPITAQAASIRLRQIAETQAGGKPVRELFLLAVAIGLLGAVACAREAEAERGRQRGMRHHG